MVFFCFKSKYNVVSSFEFKEGHFLLINISMSSLSGSGRVRIVNLSSKFGGRGFLPKSFPGFMQPNSRKFACRVMVFKSPF